MAGQATENEQKFAGVAKQKKLCSGYPQSDGVSPESAWKSSGIIKTLKPPVKSAQDVRIWRLNVLRSFVNQHYSKPVFIEFPSSLNISTRSGSWTA
jgi:hypothetical protein